MTGIFFWEIFFWASTPQKVGQDRIHPQFTHRRHGRQLNAEINELLKQARRQEREEDERYAVPRERC